jgi:hypothetical protein
VLQEDRILVTSDVDNFAKLARAATVHAGLVSFEDGGLLRADQLVRRDAHVRAVAVVDRLRRCSSTAQPRPTKT